MKELTLAVLVITILVLSFYMGYLRGNSSYKEGVSQGYLDGYSEGYRQAEYMAFEVRNVRFNSEKLLLERVENLTRDRDRLEHYFTHTWDFELMARLLSCESDHYYTKVKVANVIFNRLEDDDFPNTIMDVITAHGQFTPIGNGSAYESEATAQDYMAILQAINGDISNGALFFNNPEISAHVGWFGTLEIVSRGENTVFYKRGVTKDEVPVQEDTETLSD